MTILTFGKYKGEDIEDVPTDYLFWFCSATNEMSPDDPRRSSRRALIAEMEAELASRRKYGEPPTPRK